MAKIAPSLLSADFTKLAWEMERLRDAKVEVLHLDVMDGHFVPNITFGYSLVKALRPLAPDLVFDVHLMMTHPLSYIDKFCDAGADILTVHVECDDDIDACLDAIAAKGVKPGLSVKPKTPAEAIKPYADKLGYVLVMTVEPGFGGQSMIYDCLDKFSVVREICGSDVLISVDGGVNAANCAEVAAKGADILVAGNAVFGASDMPAAFAGLSEKVG
ncbi:MAG: ribulose-phosphate 3-epimerase [Ruminococcaceae bacterium]|nr:ribulose-phosphate 3-epimerase [Oscillospiraceae bacterium]